MRRSLRPGTVAPVQDFDVAAAAARLTERGGGYEVVHTSPGLEVGVYVLIAPEEDKQVPHALDEIYVVLDGEGEIEVAGERRPMRRGEGVYVAAGVEHNFHAYDELTLLVVFNGPHSHSLSQVSQ
jgi:mannose-6-phosphate isomerase-like protein (cupin superfamily)